MKSGHERSKPAKQFNLVKVVVQELRTTAAFKVQGQSMPTSSTWCSGKCGCACCCVDGEVV